MLLSTQLLNQRAKVLVAAGALAMLVAFTTLLSTAEAQQEGARAANPSAEPAAALQAMPEPAEQVVVNPGDSLWSISQRQLGPNATPEQIATEVERTFELNRSRIGEDPNLILAGQELLLPPASELAANEPATNTPAGEEVATKPVADAQTNESAQPATSEPALDASTEEPAEPAASQPVENEPTIGASPDIPVAYWIDERRLLGSGIIALTLVLAVLMLWKLPMRRDVGSGAWRIMPAAKAYPTNYSASQLALPAASAGRLAFAPSWSENGSSRFGNGVLTNGRISDDKPLRSRTSLSRRPLRKGWVAAVYSPQVRHSLKHATRTKTQSATTAVGRRRKNPPSLRASLSRRPLRKGWVAAVHSPQVRYSLKHATRTKTQSAGARKSREAIRDRKR